MLDPQILHKTKTKKNASVYHQSSTDLPGGFSNQLKHYTLTAQVNGIDLLVTVDYSAGKPCLFDIYQPLKETNLETPLNLLSPVRQWHSLKLAAFHIWTIMQQQHMLLTNTMRSPRQRLVFQTPSFQIWLSGHRTWSREHSTPLDFPVPDTVRHHRRRFPYARMGNSCLHGMRGPAQYQTGFVVLADKCMLKCVFFCINIYNFVQHSDRKSKWRETVIVQCLAKVFIPLELYHI